MFNLELRLNWGGIAYYSNHEKNVFLAVFVAALSSCSNSSQIDRISKELDSLKSVVATLNGTYSKAVETGAPVQGPQSEDIAERALNACKDRSIKEGMTEEEVIAVLGQPSRKENDVNGNISYYYGTSECKVELIFGDISDVYKLFFIRDLTYGAFEEEW